MSWPLIAACLAHCMQVLGITAPPAIAINPDLSRPGMYLYSTITLRPDADCGVLVHELAHHKQFAMYGIAADADEWFSREIQAARAEMRIRGE